MFKFRFTFLDFCFPQGSTSVRVHCGPQFNVQGCNGLKAEFYPASISKGSRVKHPPEGYRLVRPTPPPAGMPWCRKVGRATGGFPAPAGMPWCRKVGRATGGFRF